MTSRGLRLPNAVASLLVTGLVLAAGEAEDGGCCGRAAVLEQQYQAHIAAMEQRHEERLAALEAKYLARFEAIVRQYNQRGTAGEVADTRSVPMKSTHAVSPDGLTTRAGPHPRQLSNGDTHLAVPSMHVHEFPSGHSCSNLITGTATGYRRLLPHTGSAPSFNPSPDWIASTTGEMSLASVNNNWTTNEIQRIPSPLKVVHDSSCSNTPKLEVQMETTVPSLTATGDISGYTRTQNSGTELLNFGHHLALVMMFNSGRKLTIRHADTGNYLMCDNGLRMSSVVGVWEQVRISTVRGGMTVVCHHDTYDKILRMTGDNSFDCDSTHTYGAWERFSIFIPEGGGATTAYPGSVVIYNWYWDRYVGTNGNDILTSSSFNGETTSKGNYIWYISYAGVGLT